MRPSALPKHKGEWAEVCFLARALALGLSVSKPYGDSTAYDFIVDSGTKLHRVQVKCATRCGHAGYQFRLTHGYNRRRYRVSELDLVAAYIAPDNCWYLIPAREISSRCAIYLRPHSNHPWARYKEAWQLLN